MENRKQWTNKRCCDGVIIASFFFFILLIQMKIILTRQLFFKLKYILILLTYLLFSNSFEMFAYKGH